MLRRDIVQVCYPGPSPRVAPAARPPSPCTDCQTLLAISPHEAHLARVVASALHRHIPVVCGACAGQRLRHTTPTAALNLIGPTPLVRQVLRQQADPARRCTPPLLVSETAQWLAVEVRAPFTRTTTTWAEAHGLLLCATCRDPRTYRVPPTTCPQADTPERCDRTTVEDLVP